VPILVEHFGLQFSHDGGYRKKILSDKAMEKLMQYSWTGNVRELRNFIERIYILIPGDFVDVPELKVAGLVQEVSRVPVDEEVTLREARADFEKDFILQKINENNGNISKTAEIIGIERSYLHRKIKSYGIDI